MSLTVNSSQQTVNSSSKISKCCKSLIRMKSSRQILTIKFSIQLFRPTVRYLLDDFINVRLQLEKMQPKIRCVLNEENHIILRLTINTHFHCCFSVKFTETLSPSSIQSLHSSKHFTHRS